MKRICITLCTVVLLLLVVCAAGAETFTSGDYGYVLLEDGTAQITKYIGKAEKLDIPDTLGGVMVTAIGNSAFYGCSSLMSVSIPNGVMVMDSNPFASCHALTKIYVSPRHPYLASVDGILFSKSDKRLICYPGGFSESVYSIPQGIAVIGAGAFRGCSSLTTVTIPDSVTAIGEEAFYECDGIIAVTIPDSVTVIGSRAFSKCSSLTSVTIPNGVTVIGDSAFSSCKKLTEVTIPDSVMTVGSSVFHGCKKLTKIIVSPNHPYLTVVDSVLSSKPDNRFIHDYKVYNASTYSIP